VIMTVESAVVVLVSLSSLLYWWWRGRSRRRRSGGPSGVEAGRNAGVSAFELLLAALDATCRRCDGRGRRSSDKSGRCCPGV
jgi:hypothetical protein